MAAQASVLPDKECSLVFGYFVGEGIVPTMRKLLKESSFFETVQGDVLLVKPNWGFPYFYPGACTSPLALEAFLEIVHKRFQKILLVESDQVLVRADAAARAYGVDRLLSRFANVEFRNLSQEPTIRVNTQLDSPKVLEFPLLLKAHPLVTFPVLKTHGRCGVSLSLKNQWGCLEKQRHNLHPHLDSVIAEVNRLLSPRFALLDGLAAMEENGPKTGSPRKTALLMGSADLVALDAAAATIMGFSLKEVEHIQVAAQKGLGNTHFLLRGDIQRARFSFRPGKNNLVAQVEMALRHLPLRSLFFDTLLFSLLCQGASLYYDLWYAARGKRTAKRGRLSLCTLRRS